MPINNSVAVIDPSLGFSAVCRLYIKKEGPLFHLDLTTHTCALKDAKGGCKVRSIVKEESL